MPVCVGPGAVTIDVLDSAVLVVELLLFKVVTV
jgi:hypothetical protein